MGIKSELSVKDYVVFNLFHALRSPVLRRKRLTGRFLVPVLYNAIGVGFLIDLPGIWGIAVGIALAVVAVF